MPLQFSQAIPARWQIVDANFEIKSVDLHGRGEFASPIVIVDDFRVRSRPFPPHPHAGFSAVTYVMRDSPGSLRSRVSLGEDIVIGPGGIVWTEAGSGVLHQEIPADSRRELHGLQLFVNLSAKSKMTPPRMLRIEGADAPEWMDETGTRVHVVVGSYGGVSSPLWPAEPFDFLDIELQGALPVEFAEGRYAVAYVVAGRVNVVAGNDERSLESEQAVTIQGGAGRINFAADRAAHVIFMSGLELHDPVVSEGPFIMNDRAQLAAAIRRYRAGEMGTLAAVEA